MSYIEDRHSSFDLDEKVELKKPSNYIVILHNDDYTSMEFVVSILIKIFNKKGDEAINIMYDVHRKGKGIAGKYTRELAETKIKQVHQMARDAGYPLLCTMEKE